MSGASTSPRSMQFSQPVWHVEQGETAVPSSQKTVARSHSPCSAGRRDFLWNTTVSMANLRRLETT